MIDQCPSPMEPEQDYAPDPDPTLEVARAAAEESELSAPKGRTGGFHPDIRPGEVGPCTRCGWVWTPSSRTIRNRSQPMRCANCRTDYWNILPVRNYARHPSDPEWAKRRDTIANRKQRRKVQKMHDLAAELNVEIVGEHPIERLPPRRVPAPVLPAVVPAALDATPRAPWQSSKPRQPAIPPPPGIEDQK